MHRDHWPLAFLVGGYFVLGFLFLVSTSNGRMILDIAQASLGPAVALLAAVIAYSQAKTARSKLVLDLFDKRMDAAQKLKDVMVTILARDEVDVQDAIGFLRARDNASYLFGPEVLAFLDKIHKRISALRVAKARRERTGDAFDREQELLAELADFFTTLDTLTRPYLQMHHKL
jgi:hypothetical protein